MRSPETRKSLLDQLVPPPGYFLGAGVATTYSLEFDVLTASLLALLGEDTDPDAEPDRLATLHAIARLSKRLRVFVCQAGIAASHVATNRLFALYDRFVRPVVVREATFHPKVWILRFDPRRTPELEGRPSIYRLVCSSRNITNARCWELGVILEGTVSESGGTQQVGRAVAALCQRIVDVTGDDPGDAIESMLRELPKVEFATDRESEESVRFLWQWPGKRRLVKEIPRNGTRAIIISPFVREAFLAPFLDGFDEVHLVSTQQELDGLGAHVHEKLAGHAVYALQPRDDGEEPHPLGNGLHAKALLLETPHGTELFVGSANATNAGWGVHSVSNCEAMVALRPGPDFARVHREFIRDRRGLHPWLEEYQRAQVELDEGLEAQKQLDALRRALGACWSIRRGDRQRLRRMISSAHDEEVPLLQPHAVVSAPSLAARLAAKRAPRVFRARCGP